MVEGIYCVKTNVEALLSLHRRSLRQSFVRLYRETITSDFVQKVAETFATRILLIGMGLITSVIVARTLGPEGRGLYAVAVTIGTIGVQFGNLGLHASNTYCAAKDRGLLPALVGNTFMISFGLGGLIAVAAWVVSFQWPYLAPIHEILLGLSLIYIPLGLGYMLLQNLFLGIQRIRVYNSVELLNRFLAVILIGLIIIWGDVTVESVFGASLIALAVSLIMMIWLMQGLLPSFPVPSLCVFKETIRYGIKVYLTDFFSFLALRMNLLIVQYMLGAEMVGYYSIAITLADMIYMLPMVVGTLLFPTLSSLTKDEEKWQVTIKVTYSAVLLMAGICVGLAIVARPLILILYGKAFIPAVLLFHLSLISAFFLSIQGILVKYMASCGYPSTIMWIWFSTLLIGLPLNVLFIWATGFPGAMYASIVTNFILLLQVIFFSVRHHRTVGLA
jgi:O-antigen/teichoic acid export membrane protein